MAVARRCLVPPLREVGNEITGVYFRNPLEAAGVPDRVKSFDQSLLLVPRHSPSPSAPWPSEHVLAEIGVLRKRAHALADVGGIDIDLLPRLVGGGKAHLLQKLLHHRMHAARADILDRLVDIGRE